MEIWEFIKIQEVFEKDIFEKVYGLVQKVKYTPKVSSKYSCSTIQLHLTNYVKLHNLLVSLLQESWLEKRLKEKMKRDVKITWVSELIKMEHGDFLAKHIDKYNNLQGVIHINGLKVGTWWELCINHDIITPEKNSFTVFSWHTPHQVLPYTWDIPRYSISLGLEYI